MRLLLAILTLLTLNQAKADDISDLMRPKGYACEALMVAGDQYIEEKFDLEFANSPSHGGKEFTFSKDKYDLVVSADAKWLTITWYKEKKPIAAGQFVLGAPSDSARVAILFNPLDSSEQVSLGCLLK